LFRVLVVVSARSVKNRPVQETGAAPVRSWTLLTNHARLLLLIGRNPDARLRDLAEQAQITERAAQAIVRDLEEAGYVTRSRVGRRNTYEVHPHGRFRHPAEADHEIGELLALFGSLEPPRA
jgi:DNA-binding MarR family transcriptional regulator